MFDIVGIVDNTIIHIVTIKDINPNDEILVPYGFEY